MFQGVAAAETPLARSGTSLPVLPLPPRQPRSTHSPWRSTPQGLSFNAWGAADLLLHSDFTRAMASTVLGVVVVGFALKGLLREADGRKHKHGKRRGNVSEAWC